MEWHVNDVVAPHIVGYQMSSSTVWTEYGKKSSKVVIVNGYWL